MDRFLIALTLLFTSHCMALEEDFRWCSTEAEKGLQFCFDIPKKTEIKKDFLEGPFKSAIKIIHSILENDKFKKKISSWDFKTYSLKKSGTEVRKKVSGKLVLKKIQDARLNITLNTCNDKGRETASANYKEQKLTLNIYNSYEETLPDLIQTLSHEIFHLLKYHHPKTPDKIHYLPYTLGQSVKDEFNQNASNYLLKK